MRVRWWWAALAFGAALACGRTEPVHYLAGLSDAGPRDGGRDGGFDAGVDAGPPDAACEPRSIPLVPAVPMVMFVIDRSGSMADNLNGGSDGGPSRWRVLEESLKKALPPREGQVAMGALMFPRAGFDACSLPASVDLSPALGNSSAILRLFNTPPVGGTPTSAAAALAASHLATLHTASSARALVVATDGAPNCNASLDPLTCVCTRARSGVPPSCQNVNNCLDDVRTLATLNDLFQNSRLPTYVVGLGTTLNQFAATLDQMAVAGGVPRTGTGHRYYAADSEPELTDAFTRITAQLARCTFLINTTLGPNDRFKVLVGTDEVMPGPNGWEWLNQANGELALHGTACDRAAAGLVASALVECP